jgi:hypothetical protein
VLHQTGVNLNQLSSDVPLLLPKAFQSVTVVNPLEGVRAYGQDLKPTTQPNEELEVTTCGKAITGGNPRPKAQRIRLLANSVAGFLLRSLCASHPPIENPVRHHSFAGFFPLSVRLPLPVDLPPRHRAGVVSPSFDEICMGVQARLANCRFDGIMDIGDGREPLILFTPWSGPSKGSTLALPMKLYDAAHIRAQVRESDARFVGQT